MMISDSANICGTIDRTNKLREIFVIINTIQHIYPPHPAHHHNTSIDVHDVHHHLHDNDNDVPPTFKRRQRGLKYSRRRCVLRYVFSSSFFSTNDYLQLLVWPPLPPLPVTITPNTIVTVSGHYHHHQRCPNSCHWSTNDVDHYHTTTSTSQRMTTTNIVMGQHRTIANTSQQGPTQDIEAEGARDASRLAPWYVFLFYLLINIHLD